MSIRSLEALLATTELRGRRVFVRADLNVPLSGGQISDDSRIRASLPTLRNRWAEDGDKHTCAFFFQVIHPDALNAGDFAKGRSQSENLRAVIADVLGHGNEKCMLPGQVEAEFAKRVAAAGGLLFSAAEIQDFDALARECGQPRWSVAHFPVAS